MALEVFPLLLLAKDLLHRFSPEEAGNTHGEASIVYGPIPYSSPEDRDE